jgi:16S rRNA pseudouridine516 synthase
MKLLKLLANLGYGSRREVEALFAQGQIRHSDGQILHEKSNADYADIRVNGTALDPAPGVVLMLNKPVGYTCSTTDPNQVIYDLLPPRFRARKPIIASIGRLDRQTSGLLLLSDDGALQHRITAPKKKIIKTYIAELAEALNPSQIAQMQAQFASGSLRLDGEDSPLLPAEMRALDAQHFAVALCEGRYHQVRRMFAACGAHVENLQRVRIGALDLRGASTDTLASGAWRVLTPDELALVFAPSSEA